MDSTESETLLILADCFVFHIYETSQKHGPESLLRIVSIARNVHLTF